MGSPVPVSKEVVEIITRMRNIKVCQSKQVLRNRGLLEPQDEDDDWGRWRDVIFKAKAALKPPDFKSKTPPSRRKRRSASPEPPPDINFQDDNNVQLEQLTIKEAMAKLETTENEIADQQENTLYCPDCYLPLQPDPKPAKLYIFLHALRYTTDLGEFETEMPEWAAEGWTWDKD